MRALPLSGAAEAACMQCAGPRRGQSTDARARKAGRRRPPTREREQVPAPQHWAARWRGRAVPMHELPTTTPCSRSAAQ